MESVEVFLVDPITPTTISVAVISGVVGNLITDLGKKTSKSISKPLLNKIGRNYDDFEKKIESLVKYSIHDFAKAEEYNKRGIVDWLEDKSFVQEIVDSLLEVRPLDSLILERSLREKMPALDVDSLSSWPIDLTPEKIVSSFVNIFGARSQSMIEPEILWLFGRVQSTVMDAIDASKQKEFIEFEIDYLKHIEKRTSKVATPGVRDLHDVTQDLSIAYLPLKVEVPESDEAPAMFLESAEEIIRRFPKLTIKGPAGCGKTTLFNWIALQCTKYNSIADESAWTNKVPFLIPLRAIANAGEKAPSVRRLVEFSADMDAFARSVPESWIHQVLLSGRGILLVDGLDELPPTSRPEFWERISSISEEYPKCRIYLTSRELPAMRVGKGDSRKKQWMPPRDFVHSELKEMDSEQINSFIDRWHDAISTANSETEEKEEIYKSRNDLKTQLSDNDNKRVRELARTPLLCAMVCVLNWREEGYLPKKRSDLYHRCCDMLIVERDQKRGIKKPEFPLSQISKEDKASTLQNLAFDMMTNREEGDEFDEQNYRIEISRAKAQEWIDNYKRAFGDADARDSDARDILDFLVERTGLLREPATGRVDFAHRSFQEYLAACWAGYKGEETHLAKYADDDQWHETIILAAGTPVGGVKYGERLIDSLLKRAVRFTSDKSTDKRKTCFALAFACFDNLQYKKPELREQVYSSISEIIPPSDEKSAKIVALAGNSAVGHLGYGSQSNETSSSRAACALALTEIGTERAIAELKNGYTTDTDYETMNVVVNHSGLQLNEIESVSSHIAEHKRLPAFAPVTQISELPSVDLIETLEIGLPVPPDVCDLNKLTRLREITIGCDDVSQLESPSFPDTLKKIIVVGASGDLDPILSKAKGVDELALVNTSVLMTKLPAAITRVDVRGHSNIQKLFAVLSCEKLEHLSISDRYQKRPMGSFVDLNEFPHLKSLSISTPEKRPIKWPASLSKTSSITELSMDLPMGELAECNFDKFGRLQKLTFASRTRQEIELDLTELKHLKDFRFRLERSAAADSELRIHLPQSVERLYLDEGRNSHILNGEDNWFPRLQHLAILGAGFAWKVRMLSQIESVESLSISSPSIKFWSFLPRLEALQHLILYPREFNSNYFGNAALQGIRNSSLKKLSIVGGGKFDKLFDLVEERGIETVLYDSIDVDRPKSAFVKFETNLPTEIDDEIISTEGSEIYRHARLFGGRVVRIPFHYRYARRF